MPPAAGSPGGGYALGALARSAAAHVKVLIDADRASSTDLADDLDTGEGAASPSTDLGSMSARPDETTGEAICAFVVLKQPRPAGKEADRLAAELRAWIGKEIGPIAKPREIRFAENLPKTRSGKIMRRLLRSVARTRTRRSSIS